MERLFFWIATNRGKGSFLYLVNNKQYLPFAKRNRQILNYGQF